MYKGKYTGILYSVQWLFEFKVNSVFLIFNCLWYLTTVVLIRPVPTVIAEVTHSVVLHTYTVVARKHILWTQGLGLWDENQIFFMYMHFSCTCACRAGNLLGRVQLVKSMSSMAMCPGLVKVLEAWNRMVKSWGIRPTITSPWRHKSPWLPDSHHSVVVLEPSFNTTISSSVSVTM